MAIGGPANSQGNGDEAIFSEINITPLTDIFLVLLIIFMVTTTTIVMQGTNVNLPQSSSGAGQSSGLIITLTKENRIMVNDKESDLGGLERLIKGELLKAKDKTAILRADRAVNLGEVIKVMTIAKKSGAEKLAILTKPEDEK